jgi:hypothetical protein
LDVKNCSQELTLSAGFFALVEHKAGVRFAFPFRGPEGAFGLQALSGFGRGFAAVFPGVLAFLGIRIITTTTGLVTTGTIAIWCLFVISFVFTRTNIA